MIIRVLDEERADKCDDLLTKLCQDERQYDDSIEEDFIVKGYFRNMIVQEENILLCYEEDSIIKGYMFLKPNVRNNKVGYLVDGLFVLEEYRNGGIATSLLEEGFRILKEKNVKFIDINVLVQNKNAIELYQKLGFNDVIRGMSREL